MTDRKVNEEYYQPDHLGLVARQLKNCMKSPLYRKKKCLKSRLAKKAIWQVHIRLLKEINHTVTKPNEQYQFDILCAP